MQNDETKKIEGKLTASRVKLLATVKGLDPWLWDWRPEDGRWSIRLTLAHVGSAQWSHLEVVKHLLAGGVIEIAEFDLDKWNQEHVAEREDWPVEQVLSDLDNAHRETLSLLSELDTEQLQITGSHPALGEVIVGQVLRVIGLHDNLHRRDIVRLKREMDVER